MSGKRKANSILFISWRKLVVLFIFASGFIFFFAFGGHQYLNFETLKVNRDKLLQYSEQNYWTMVTGAAVIYTAVTALSIPLASGLSLMIGFLFGRWIGMIVILFSATLGATLAFLGARFVFAEAAQRRMGKVTRKIIAAFHENDFNYLLFLRLIPLFPFWLVNLACAFTLMKTRTYIMATAVGIAPGCFVLANLGQSLSRIDSTEKLYSLQTLGAWVLVGIFALLPAFIKKIRLSKAREAF